MVLDGFVKSIDLLLTDDDDPPSEVLVHISGQEDFPVEVPRSVALKLKLAELVGVVVGTKERRPKGQLIYGPTLQMVKTLPEDVRNSPYLAEVLEEQSTRTIDSVGRLAVEIMGLVHHRERLAALAGN